MGERARSLHYLVWCQFIQLVQISEASKGPFYNIFKRDKIEEALRLADLSAEKPHFSHCLEWLLFTVFKADIS
ncbi:hypothetical protein S83_011368, partial [Arachis hypogaea]